MLTIGETIEEVHDTGFLSSGPTIAVQQLRDSGLLQVHPHGLRHVLPNKTINDWSCPPGTQVIAATTNKRQVVLALNTAELIYFEVDTDGTLGEFDERKSLPANATCLSIGEVPAGRQRAPFLVSTSVGQCQISRRWCSTLPFLVAGCRLREPDGPHHLNGDGKHLHDSQSTGKSA